MCFQAPVGIILRQKVNVLYTFQAFINCIFSWRLGFFYTIVIAILKLTLVIKDIKVKTILAAILLLSAIAKADSIVIKLTTDSETLKRVDAVNIKFALINGNSFTAGFTSAETQSGNLEKKLDLPSANVKSCYFDWFHRLLKEDTPAKEPNPFNDRDKTCQVEGNVVTISPSATVQIAKLQIEASAFSKRNASAGLFGVKPESLSGKIEYSAPLMQGNIANAPFVRAVSTLSFEPLKYLFQATWFKNQGGTEKETIEFQDDLILID